MLALHAKGMQCQNNECAVHNDTTNKQDVINEKNVHNHGDKVDNAAVVIARTTCKHKATEDAALAYALLN